MRIRLILRKIPFSHNIDISCAKIIFTEHGSETVVLHVKLKKNIGHLNNQLYITEFCEFPVCIGLRSTYIVGQHGSNISVFLQVEVKMIYFFVL